MFTSVTTKLRAKSGKRALKAGTAYLAVSASCILFNQIYALFGHGVHSASMSLLFLYPLLGGALPFLLIWLFTPRSEQTQSYRFSCNCYNSGIAALTVGSLLQGVFEIAGTSSPYLAVFFVCGWTLWAFALMIFFADFYLSRRKKSVN